MGVFIPVFNAPPKSLLDIAGNFDLGKLRDLFSVIGPPDQTLDFAQSLLTSPREMLDEWFDSEVVKAPLARLAAELGAPPSQKALAFGATMMAMRHEPGMARPEGGTGALVAALVRLVQALGGIVRCNAPVKRIVVEDNRAVGVETADGRFFRASKGVLSNIDAKRVFLHLVEPGAVDPVLRERVERKIGNSNETILKIDLALSEPPLFVHHDHRDEYLIGSVLIADSVDQVEIAHSETVVGRIPDADPSMYLVVPSVLDPTLAPPGKHTAWIEFFAPYQVAGAAGTGRGGTGWTDELKNKVADRVIAKLSEYAPNLERAIIARHVESPADLADRLGALKGNYYHLDMTIDYLLFFRPLPELANYRTPIEGLYLTGAGTHPGGSISGMPGRNCARVFLHDQQPVSTTLREAAASLKDTAVAAYRSLKKS